MRGQYSSQDGSASGTAWGREAKHCMAGGGEGNICEEWPCGRPGERRRRKRARGAPGIHTEIPLQPVERPCWRKEKLGERCCFDLRFSLSKYINKLN